MISSWKAQNMYKYLLLLLPLVVSQRHEPHLDDILPWYGTPVENLPRLCVLARTYPSQRLQRLLPAFLHSLLGGGYPALTLYLINTEFLSGDSKNNENYDAFLESTVKGIESVYRQQQQESKVRLVHLHPGDSDVGDAILGLSRWSARDSGDFAQAKGPRWTRGWVSTDVVLHRLLACGGRWEEGCPWDTTYSSNSNASTASLPTCEYFLFTNTDNAYGAAFLSEVWEKGIAPLWQGSREGFWGGVRRTGRDLVGVNYITYYKSGGASGLGEESSRFGPRIVAFPPHPSSEGQSLDLGALVWSGRALVESKGGGGFLVRELRERVLGGLVGAAQQKAATSGAGAGGGDGGDGEASAVSAAALSAAVTAPPLLCTTGLALFCDPHWGTLGGQRTMALHVEEALKGVWPTVYARDHVQAHEVHSTVILPKRLEIFNQRRGKDESTRFAEALVAAARGEGGMGLGKATATPDLDPVIVLPGMLFFHQ